jgi:hypothetical protein
MVAEAPGVAAMDGRRGAAGYTSSMRFAYYDRLSAARKAIYRKSDAIGAVGLPPGLEVGDDVARIRAALAAADRGASQRACQRLVDALVGGFKVPPIRVRVLAKRPSDDYGELHGLYEPEEGRVPARVTVWMRTAKRVQVVAFKSFLRTLVHELAHHLDYELYLLEETFHTEGFYQRESSLAHALLDAEAKTGATPPA